MAAPGTDVIFIFNSATWDDVLDRHMCFTEDRLLMRLRTRPEIRRLLVVEGLRSAPVRLARRVLTRRSTPFPADEKTTLHSPVCLRRKDPVSIAGLRDHYRRHDLRLAAAAERGGLVRPLVITSNPFVAAFCALDWAAEVVFYGWDDWAAHPSVERWWPCHENAYGAIHERRCEVWAVSQAIIDRISPRGRSRVVPNGVEPGEWECPADPPGWFASLPHPRILYTGTLDRRVDVGALARIAGCFEEASLALVGSVSDRAHFAALAGLPNVHFAGELPRSEVPALVSAAEVCVIPHARSRLTEAMSPLKLYEYLAAGRPVAATDLPAIRGVDDRVILVAEGEDFAEAVRRAIALGPAPDTERRAFARENSWRRRHEPLLDDLLRRTAFGVSASASTSSPRAVPQA